MKYLCLAYGDEKDWNVLTKKEQGEMLAQDEVLRKRGVLVAAVQTTVTTVRAWDGKPTTTDGAFADSKASLAGFSIIEFDDLDEGEHRTRTPDGLGPFIIGLGWRFVDNPKEDFASKIRVLKIEECIHAQHK
jgi:hypothetical protein